MLNKLIFSSLIILTSASADEGAKTYQLQKTGEVNFLQEGEIHSFKASDKTSPTYETTVKPNPEDIKKITTSGQVFAVVEGHPYLLTKNLGEIDFSDVIAYYSQIYPDFKLDNFDSWHVTEEGRVVGTGNTGQNIPGSLNSIRVNFFYDPFAKNAEEKVVHIITGNLDLISVNEKGDLLSEPPYNSTAPTVWIRNGKTYVPTDVK